MKSRQFPIVLFLSLWLFLLGDVALGAPDSLMFKSIQAELEGCWRTKHYQFKYDPARNLGSEFKSRVRSSAPIFKLIIKDDDIYIEWMELLGGEHYQKIDRIKRNRLFVINEAGTKFSYKRNKGCR